MRTPRRTAAALAVAFLCNLLAGVALTSTAYAADGIAADSSSTTCSSGYYFCWSNAQQKSVCTTRKCY
jgi:hypothetical protein